MESFSFGLVLFNGFICVHFHISIDEHFLNRGIFLFVDGNIACGDIEWECHPAGYRFNTVAENFRREESISNEPVNTQANSSPPTR